MPGKYNEIPESYFTHCTECDVKFELCELKEWNIAKNVVYKLPPGFMVLQCPKCGDQIYSFNIRKIVAELIIKDLFYFIRKRGWDERLIEKAVTKSFEWADVFGLGGRFEYDDIINIAKDVLKESKKK